MKKEILLPSKTLKIKIEVILNPRQAHARMKKLAGQKGLLAFDYEGTGLKPERKQQKIVKRVFLFKMDRTLLHVW